MNKIILYTVLILFSFITKTMAQKVAIKDSSSWSFRQDEPKSYEIGPAEDPIYANQEVYTIKSIEEKIKGFGNIMKTIDATSYQGKTVKMSGYIKTESSIILKPLPPMSKRLIKKTIEITEVNKDTYLN